MNTQANSRSIEARAFRQLQIQNQALVLIDVSTPVEHREAHVHGAINLPIGSSELSEYMAARNGKSDEPCYVMCRGGVRSVKVCNQFPDAKVVDVAGGLKRWKEEGLPVTADKKVVSLERQVRMTAGTIVMLGAVLGVLVHPYFMAVPAFVGGGLFYAGATNSCAMAMLLTKMPWNRAARPKTAKAVASFSH